MVYRRNLVAASIYTAGILTMASTQFNKPVMTPAVEEVNRISYQLEQNIPLEALVTLDHKAKADSLFARREDLLSNPSFQQELDDYLATGARYHKRIIAPVVGGAALALIGIALIRRRKDKQYV